MNRRINSVLFVIAATIANIVVMMILFVVLLLVFARFFAPSLPPQANQIMLMVLFVGSVVATYVIYHRVVRRLGEQYDLQKYFGPIFGKDRHPPV
jgi:membrane protein implicated in regulation of membrane protease activity